MTLPRVLVVEDDRVAMESYRIRLESTEYELFEATSFKEALIKLENNEFAVVFTDLILLEVEYGFEILKRTKNINPNTQVIIVTAFGSQRYAMAATRQGALDYVTKPIDYEKLNYIIKNGIRVFQELTSSKAHQSNTKSSEQVEEDIADIEHVTIIGNSARMNQVHTAVANAASIATPVLISGEFGTGKEHIAKSIHYNSNRPNPSFGRIGCRELDNLQLRAYIRLLELRGGTLFLDNLHALTEENMALAFEIMRRCEPLDIRIIAASNIGLSDLKQFLNFPSIDVSKFDLSKIFDDKSIMIWVPPLRMRKDGDDIASLAGHFLGQEGETLQLDDRAIEALAELDYSTTNVRELRELILTAAEQVHKEGGNAIFRQHILGSISQISQSKPSEKSIRVFVSYSSLDRDFVRRILDNLVKISNHSLDFWVDYRRIRIGSQFWDRDIQHGLESSEVMLLIVSPNSMKSLEVKREWNYFLGKNRPILMLVYQEAEVSYRLEPIQRVQYSKQAEDEIGSIVVNALENLLQYS